MATIQAVVPLWSESMPLLPATSATCLKKSASQVRHESYKALLWWWWQQGLGGEDAEKS